MLNFALHLFHSSVLAVDDPANCTTLITEHKYSEEMVRALKYMQGQQERQAAGVKIFRYIEH